MSTAESKAVFLSYASQDADAARRICEALRAAGVEVWFDQSELSTFAELRRDKRGGDAWDARLRREGRVQVARGEWKNAECNPCFAFPMAGNPQSEIRDPQ